MKTGEDCAIFPCPDVSPGGFEPPTFRLGGEPSIQLRYEDILDFPLFSRLCRDGQENHESNDSARRSESPFPVSNAEQKIRNSVWRMITFFLGASPAFGYHYPSVFTCVHETRVFPAFFHVQSRPLFTDFFRCSPLSNRFH